MKVYKIVYEEQSSLGRFAIKLSNTPVVKPSMYIFTWVGGYGSLEFTFANLCCTPSSALHCKLWATFTTVDLATLLIALGNPNTAWQQQDIVQKLFLRCLGWQWARYYPTILVCSFSATKCQFTLIWYEGVVSKIHNVKPFSDNFSKIFFPLFIISNIYY